MTTPGDLKGAANVYPLQRPSPRVSVVSIDLYS